jgi:hypothetical protein
MRNAYEITDGKYEERKHWKDLSVDGTSLKWNLNRVQFMGWIRLAQDRVKWLALVYTIMNLRFT